MARPRMITVEPVLFFFMLSVFLVGPLQEQLIYKKICHSKYNETVCKNLKSDDSYIKEESYVQKQTSNWSMYLRVTTTIPSMLAAMILGPCSDKIGRKFSLILPLIGTIIEAGGLILNSYYLDWDVSIMCVGGIIAGFSGSYATLLMAVFSYMADISSEKNRTLRVALLESMIFLGGSIGELVGGVLVDHAGFFVAFSLAVGLYLLNLLYVIFILQESYHPQEKLRLSQVLCDFKHLANSVRVFAKKRQNRQRSKLLLLMLTFFCSLMVFLGSNTIKVLFVLHRPLSFSSSMIGYNLAVSLLYRGIGVVVGMPLFIHYLKLSDYTMAIFGLVTTIVMFIGLAFATKLWMVFVVPLVDFFGGITVPCLRALFSKTVGKEEQGTLFSGIASVEVLCSVVAAVLFNNVYTATVDWHPGFCFFVISAVLVVPVIILWYLKTVDTQTQYSEFTPEQDESDDASSKAAPDPVNTERQPVV